MYRGTPRNIYRHIIISDIKEAMSALPRVSDRRFFWLLFMNLVNGSLFLSVV